MSEQEPNRETLESEVNNAFNCLIPAVAALQRIKRSIEVDDDIENVEEDIWKANEMTHLGEGHVRDDKGVVSQWKELTGYDD